MKKLTTLALLSAIALTSAAFADDSKMNDGKMTDKMDSTTSTTKKTKKAKKTTSSDKMSSTTDKMQKTDKM